MESYVKINIDDHELNSEDINAACLILRAREIRSKWLYVNNTRIDLPGKMFKITKEEVQSFSYKMVNGIVNVYSEGKEGEGKSIFQSFPIEEFIDDYSELRNIQDDGEVRTFCHQRIALMEKLIDLHNTLNSEKENSMSKKDQADLFSIAKIDNHVHLAAAYNCEVFLNFIKEKFNNSSSDIIDKSGKTLKDVAKDLNIIPDSLTVDSVDILADATLFDRFDRFNAKYNPLGQSILRSIFLKTDNYLEGRYMAELTKNLLNRMERKKTMYAEFRLSIYGTEKREWEKLSSWVMKNNLISPNNRWMVQVPRVYRFHKAAKIVNNFQDLLDNIFLPLFESTIYPEKNPFLAEFLLNLGGFDSVDDESLHDEPLSNISPENWNSKLSPPYSWQLYHMATNIKVLNQLRESLGLNTFSFRPHAGESGDSAHLLSTYMLADGINHGINLHHRITLQYLYFLDQVGISVAPMSNNFLFLRLRDSPFLKFFKRGLNVTLSTDDPLFFHLTDDPLLEEYAVARQHWMLSVIDLSEIARNSVLQSSFPHSFKQERLGDSYLQNTNDSNKTNVPMARFNYRRDTLNNEILLLSKLALKLTKVKSTSLIEKHKEMEEQKSVSVDSERINTRVRRVV